LGVPCWAEKPRKGGREVRSSRTFKKIGTFLKGKILHNQMDLKIFLFEEGI
jgi:hypothetical protein